jgi:hypothetical protein
MGKFGFPFGSSDRHNLFIPLSLLSRSLPILTPSRSGRTARPTVTYSDPLTISPVPVVLQRADEDPNNNGSPRWRLKTFNDEFPRRSRRISTRSTRRRTTDSGRAVDGRNSVSNLGQGAAPATVLQRVKSNFSSLLVPEYKVGKPPGFVEELKAIFGSCASPCSIFLRCIWCSDPVC